MISNTTIIITILAGIAAGALAVGIQRLKFKKSIVFNIAAIVVFPVVLGCAVGFILGARGVIHFLWATPLVILVTTICLEVIAHLLQKPLKELINSVESLSQGDVEVAYSEKFQKGSHELAQVMRRLAKLTDALKNIVTFANHVGKGELNTEYALLGEKDSLGKSLLDMRDNLQKAELEKAERQQEDEHRNWASQGLAKFAELLRTNNDNIEELCHSIVSHLVKYIGANQAGIFILNDEDTANPVLELKGCYAYERRKYIQKTIALGEGLVGACFLEREKIYMTRLPTNYIRITSGLGGEVPCALLIVPLKVNEDVYGVIEIAAFKEFAPHVCEFVEKVSESIASIIGSVKVSMRTNKLLVQSKIQAEEMANQEEELRQNMEEMQATQEEMRRRESELQDTLVEIQKAQTISDEKEHEMQQFYRMIYESNNVIEVSPQAIITNVNQNFLNLTGTDNSTDLIGKHVSVFIGEEAFRLADGKMRDGGQFEDLQRVTTGDGKTLALRQKYMPICNRQGELMRVLILIFLDHNAEIEIL